MAVPPLKGTREDVNSNPNEKNITPHHPKLKIYTKELRKNSTLVEVLM